MATMSLKAAFLVVFLVTIQSSLSCRYFCRERDTGVYHCCDEGNPYTTSTVAPRPVSQVTEAAHDEGTEDTEDTDAEDEGMTTPGPVLEYGPEDGAKYNESSGCRYYCAYRNSVYCCDDGSLKMPEDHDPNTGRCPTYSEQVCKNDAIYLAPKARKTSKTKTGTEMLSKIGSEEVLCASDGYCGEDERCCPSVCHKRHACMKTMHNDKTKP